MRPRMFSFFLSWLLLDFICSYSILQLRATTPTVPFPQRKFLSVSALHGQKSVLPCDLDSLFEDSLSRAENHERVILELPPQENFPPGPKVRFPFFSLAVTRKILLYSG